MVLLNLLYKLHWGRHSKGKKGLVIGQVLLLGGPTQPSSFSKAKVNLLLIQDKTTRRAVCGERCSVFGMGTTASLRQGRCFCQRKWWENIWPKCCKQTRHKLFQNKRCGSYRALITRGTGLAVYAEVRWRGCPYLCRQQPCTQDDEIQQ